MQTNTMHFVKGATVVVMGGISCFEEHHCTCMIVVKQFMATEQPITSRMNFVLFSATQAEFMAEIGWRLC
jgi:hypothetical protein